MSIDNLTNAERAKWNYDFDTYYKAEHDAEARRVRIEDTVAEMTKEGNAFYPFLPANFHEAICQMSDENINDVGAYAHSANMGKYDMSDFDISDLIKINLANKLMDISKEYWENTARVIIERDKLVD